MPYCCKCGVEVDYNIRKCPLCEFLIPEINPDEEKDNDRYPSPQNLYPKKAQKRKRKIFLTISVLILSIAGILMFQDIFINSKLTWSRYSFVSLICSLIYLFFLFGFIPRFRISIIGASINTIILLYFLDKFNGKLEWFELIGVPCVFMCTIATIIIGYLFKKTKRKGFNIVSYVLLAISFYCIGIEAFISLNINKFIRLHWSIIVLILLLPLSILLLYLHYGLPEKYKVKFKRKFHI